MYLKINPDNPQPRLIKQVVDCLKSGGVIIYPTDTTYGLGCDIFNRKAVKKIFQIKQRDQRKPFSFICNDLAEISTYAQVSNFAFTKIVPDSLSTKQKTVGIRMPENAISQAIVAELGNPLVTTSANISGEDTPEDPQDIEVSMGQLVDFVIDGGVSINEASSVISLLNDETEILRQGSGDTSWLD